MSKSVLSTTLGFRLPYSIHVDIFYSKAGKNHKGDYAFNLIAPVSVADGKFIQLIFKLSPVG